MAEEVVPDVAERDDVAASRASRPSTDTNIVIQVFVGLIGTAIVWAAVQPLQNTRFSYLWGIICDRGPVQYAELFMAFMTAAFIFMKARIIRGQLGVMAEGPIDQNLDLTDDEQIQDMRNAIFDREAFSWSIILNRIDRMLALWLGSKDVSRVASWAEAESERDSSSSDSSYATVRVLIWAIPIMGFIGTVMGLSDAVSGFADFLRGAAELSQIKDAIGSVTIGLGVAFDTTLLALILSVFLMFPLASTQRKEETFFVEVDNYLDDMITSRLPSPEQQPVVIENLEDAIEAAFRRYIPDPDRYDEVFTRSIDKAAGVVEERFANLARSYESTLSDLTGQLSSSVATAGDSLQSAFQRMIQDLQGEEDKLIAKRKDMGSEEVDRFKEAMKEIYASVQEQVKGYQSKVAELQQATSESSQHALSAAEALGQRMQELTKMASAIEDLLHIEQAVEKGVQGIAAGEDFQQTLSALREHLAATDEFCNRMSKPRVITLREEPA